jgi:hypothetical protein
MPPRSGAGYVHENDWLFVFAKCVRELDDVIGNCRRRMNGPYGDDALLHVDQDQAATLSIWVGALDCPFDWKVNAAGLADPPARPPRSLRALPKQRVQ